jgi:hypothetical protein
VITGETRSMQKKIWKISKNQYCKKKTTMTRCHIQESNTLCKEFIHTSISCSQSHVFWDITQCSPVKANRRFGGKYYLHLKIEKQARLAYTILCFSTCYGYVIVAAFYACFLFGLYFDPKDEGDMFLRKISYFHRTTWRYNPEGWALKFMYSSELIMNRNRKPEKSHFNIYCSLLLLAASKRNANPLISFIRARCKYNRYFHHQNLLTSLAPTTRPDSNYVITRVKIDFLTD